MSQAGLKCTCKNRLDHDRQNNQLKAFECRVGEAFRKTRALLRYLDLRLLLCAQLRPLLGEGEDVVDLSQQGC